MKEQIGSPIDRQEKVTFLEGERRRLVQAIQLEPNKWSTIKEDWLAVKVQLGEIQR